MQQQVRVGEDDLLREHGDRRRILEQRVQFHLAEYAAGRLASLQPPLMALSAAGLEEERAAAQHVRVPGIGCLVVAAPFGNGQKARVELDQGEPHVFDVHAERVGIGLLESRGRAGGLAGSAGFLNREAAGHAHVEAIGIGRLLQEGRRARLVAETPEAARIHRLVVDHAHPTADVVAVAVVRVRKGPHLRFRHGAEQAEADQLRRDPRRELDALRKCAVAEFAHLVHGAAQLEGCAVVVGAAHRLVLHRGEAFADGGMSAAAERGQTRSHASIAVEGREPEGLQHRAVAGIGDGLAVCIDAEAEANGHGIHRRVLVGGRRAAPVAGVAALAGAGVQQRAFAIVGVAEYMVAGLEVGVRREVALDVGRGLAKRFLVGERRRRGTARKTLGGDDVGNFDACRWRRRWRRWRGRRRCRTSAAPASAAGSEQAGADAERDQRETHPGAACSERPFAEQLGFDVTSSHRVQARRTTTTA